MTKMSHISVGLEIIEANKSSPERHISPVRDVFIMKVIDLAKMILSLMLES